MLRKYFECSEPGRDPAWQHVHIPYDATLLLFRQFAACLDAAGSNLCLFFFFRTAENKKICLDGFARMLINGAMFTNWEAFLSLTNYYYDFISDKIQLSISQRPPKIIRKLTLFQTYILTVSPVNTYYHILFVSARRHV